MNSKEKRKYFDREKCQKISLSSNGSADFGGLLYLLKRQNRNEVAVLGIPSKSSGKAEKKKHTCSARIEMRHTQSIGRPRGANAGRSHFALQHSPSALQKEAVKVQETPNAPLGGKALLRTPTHRCLRFAPFCDFSIHWM